METTHNKKYKLVIWDVDGTILDTSVGLLESVRYLVKETGIKMPDEETLRSFVGPRIQDSLNRVYGLTGDKLKELSDMYREHYKEYDVLKAIPYQGIYEAIDGFKNRGIKQAVATNKRQDLAEMILKEYKMHDCMDIICGTDRKGIFTKADLIQACIDGCGVKVSETVMIGDSEYDAEAAAEVGVDFCAVTYGFGYKDENSLKNTKAVKIINSSEDIVNSI